MTPAQRQIALRKIALPAIPDDWEVVTVGSIAQRKPNSIVGGPFGSDLVSTDYVPAGVPVIRGQNMGQAFVSGDFVFVSEEKAKALSSNLAAPGDVIFTQRGTLGQVSVVPDGPFDRYLVSQSQMKLSVDTQQFDIAFLCHYFGSAAGQQQIVESAIQTGVPHTNLSILRGYFLPRPPLPEQQTIAAALSDADGVVAGLERVIAKKRLIKQGAMQDLLTARRRLPGFSGEWETKRLGAALTVRHGRSQKDVEHPFGEYPILATGGQIGTATKFLCDKPSVLIGRKGTIDVPRFMDKPFWSVDTLFYTDVHAGYDAKFLFYAFLLVDWMSYNEASGVPSLNAKTIEGIEAQFPSLDEQQAIAAVLSDMDAEIQTLEARLTKARAVKEGMMQNLLTGRVRLV